LAWSSISHKFAQTSDLAPVATNREGIYVCGVFQGPKDIPQSVMEASAASSAAASNLAAARGTLTRTQANCRPNWMWPNRSPGWAVFVCNCGINIGGVADVPAVREYARTLAPRGARRKTTCSPAPRTPRTK
jgi:heterodisulfide reductase subunit A